MHCEVFTDPMYNGERFVDFEAAEVVSMEERTLKLFPRRRYRVTNITLRDGSQHLLAGEWAAQIQAAQATAPSPSEQVSNLLRLSDAG